MTTPDTWKPSEILANIAQTDSGGAYRGAVATIFDSHAAELARVVEYLTVFAKYHVSGVVVIDRAVASAARVFLAANPVEPTLPEKPADVWPKWFVSHLFASGLAAVCRVTELGGWFWCGTRSEPTTTSTRDGALAGRHGWTPYTHADAVALIPAIKDKHPLPTEQAVCADEVTFTAAAGSSIYAYQGGRCWCCYKDGEFMEVPVFRHATEHDIPRDVAESRRPAIKTRFPVSGRVGSRACGRCGASFRTIRPKPSDGTFCSLCYAPVEEWNASRTIHGYEASVQFRPTTDADTAAFRPTDAWHDEAEQIVNSIVSIYRSVRKEGLYPEPEQRLKDHIASAIATRDARIAQLEAELARTTRGWQDRMRIALEGAAKLRAKLADTQELSKLRGESEDRLRVERDAAIATRDARIKELNTMLAERNRTIWERSVDIKELEAQVAKVLSVITTEPRQEEVELRRQLDNLKTRSATMREEFVELDRLKAELATLKAKAVPEGYIVVAGKWFRRASIRELDKPCVNFMMLPCNPPAQDPKP